MEKGQGKKISPWQWWIFPGNGSKQRRMSSNKWIGSYALWVRKLDWIEKDSWGSQGQTCKAELPFSSQFSSVPAMPFYAFPTQMFFWQYCFKCIANVKNYDYRILQGFFACSVWNKTDIAPPGLVFFIKKCTRHIDVSSLNTRLWGPLDCGDTPRSAAKSRFHFHWRKLAHRPFALQRVDGVANSRPGMNNGNTIRKPGVSVASTFTKRERASTKWRRTKKKCEFHNFFRHFFECETNRLLPDQGLFFDNEVYHTWWYIIAK